MRVLVATSWDTACGIAEHTRSIKEAVEKADPEIMLVPHAQALDPAWALEYATAPTGPALEPIAAVWINHHDALHSRWQLSHIKQLQARGIKVLVTYHDTREDLEACPKLKEWVGWADHIVVHEPVAGLSTETPWATYLRQGVPAASYKRELLGFGPDRDVDYLGQPILGTVGFDFPWKNYTRLAELTAEIGWAFMCLCPNLTEERYRELKAINPWLITFGRGTMPPADFAPVELVGSCLRTCTATAFMYECANTGTSGAIRLGIAARKPVFAFGGCRQFRDLYEDHDHEPGPLINWAKDWPTLRRLLIQSWPVDVDPAIVYLAERDSLTKVGARYAQILRSL